MAGAYSGPHERRLLHDLMDQYNKVTNNTNIIVNMSDIDNTKITMITTNCVSSWSGLQSMNRTLWCSPLVSPSSRSSTWWVCGDDHEDDNEDYGGRDTKTVGFLSRNLFCITVFSFQSQFPWNMGRMKVGRKLGKVDQSRALLEVQMWFAILHRRRCCYPCPTKRNKISRSN